MYWYSLELIGSSFYTIYYCLERTIFWYYKILNGKNYAATILIRKNFILLLFRKNYILERIRKNYIPVLIRGNYKLVLDVYRSSAPGSSSADIRMNFDIRIRNISCGCHADIANNKRIIFLYS